MSEYQRWEARYAKPDYEFRESEAKARAMLQAIELAVGQPDWP